MLCFVLSGLIICLMIYLFFNIEDSKLLEILVVIVGIILLAGVAWVYLFGAIKFIGVEKQINDYDIVEVNECFYSETIFENRPLILFTVKANDGEVKYTVSKENCEIVYDSTEKSYVEIQEIKLNEKKVWHLLFFKIPDDEVLDVKYILHLPSE